MDPAIAHKGSRELLLGPNPSRALEAAHSPDRTLTADPEIVFNAGSHVNAIRMRYEDYAMLVQPVVGEFSRHSLTRTARARG